MVVDHSETGVKKETYQNNTEWEMMKVTVKRKEVSIKMFCRGLCYTSYNCYNG